MLFDDGTGKREMISFFFFKYPAYCNETPTNSNKTEAARWDAFPFKGGRGQPGMRALQMGEQS